MKIIEHNTETNQRIERDATNEEIAAWSLSEQQLQLAMKMAAQRERHSAYLTESDPLFFGWQRGENTEQEWLDKVAEIRARYPYS